MSETVENSQNNDEKTNINPNEINELSQRVDSLNVNNNPTTISGLVDEEHVETITVQVHDGQKAVKINPYESKLKSFKEMKLLKPELVRATTKLGWHEPSYIQGVALPMILKHNNGVYRNLIGQGKTGSGKTGAFVLSMLQRIDEDSQTFQALCICHTRELAIQTYDVCKQLGQFLPGFSCFVALPGQKFPSKWSHQIVIGTPGWIIQNIFNESQEHIIKQGGLVKFLRKFKILVVDEADELLRHPTEIQKPSIAGRSGRKTRNAFGNLTDQLQTLVSVLNNKRYIPNGYQCLLFSATFPNSVKKIAMKICKSPALIAVKKKEVKLENVKMCEIQCLNEEDKFRFVENLFGLAQVGQMIIFVNSIKKAKELIGKLQNQSSISCSALYGRGMDVSLRDKLMQQFRDKKTVCLVASNVIARGIDVPAVKLVINYEIPRSVTAHSKSQKVKGIFDGETFIHRAGRTGRFGTNGAAISLTHDEGSSQLLQGIKQSYGLNIKEFKSEEIVELAKELVSWVGEGEIKERTQQSQQSQPQTNNS